MGTRLNGPLGRDDRLALHSSPDGTGHVLERAFPRDMADDPGLGTRDDG